MKKDLAKCQSQRSFSGLISNSGPPEYEVEVLTASFKKEKVGLSFFYLRLTQK
jgi:hypothetical protein